MAGCIAAVAELGAGPAEAGAAAAITAHAAFAEAELGRAAGRGAAAAVDRARRAAGVASNNLETTLSRALHEPRRSQRGSLQSAMVVDAALRRMAGRLSALQLDPHHADGIAPEALRGWREWIGARCGGGGGSRLAAPGRPAGRRTRCCGSRGRSSCWTARGAVGR